MQSSPKILLIEDNRSLIHALTEALRMNFEIESSVTGKNGLYKAEISDYDVILLDLQLPDMYGLDVCQQLRERGVNTPVLILSAEAKILSKINLLDAGANDYLTKPFSLGELKARIRVLLRQNKIIEDKPKGILWAGELSLSTATHEVLRAGQLINLRRKEFMLLECLMHNAGKVVTREMLIRYAWHGSDKPWTNTIDVHMKHLRDKIDRSHDTKYIKTVHGLGYKLVDEIPDKMISLN
jgi:two-component system copper resistance phosphate regulon response regulator CusR